MHTATWSPKPRNHCFGCITFRTADKPGVKRRGSSRIHHEGTEGMNEPEIDPQKLQMNT
jgi:hypothetical protein